MKRTDYTVPATRWLQRASAPVTIAGALTLFTASAAAQAKATPAAPATPATSAAPATSTAPAAGSSTATEATAEGATETAPQEATSAEPAAETPPPAEPPADGPPPVVEPVYSESDSAAEPTPPEDPVKDAPPPRQPTPFDQYNVRVSLILGGGSYGTSSYFILGGGAGFFVLDGLEVGLNGQMWLGGSPFIGELTPTLTYVLHFVPRVKPYAGMFFTRTFIDGQDGYNSMGPRAGVNVMLNPNAYVGVGAAWEFILDCDNQFISCDALRPEILVAFSF